VTPEGGSNKVGRSGLRFEMSSESYSSGSSISRTSEERIFNFDAGTDWRTLVSVWSVVL
jgi:hypothetical protein